MVATGVETLDAVLAAGAETVEVLGVEAAQGGTVVKMSHGVGEINGIRAGSPVELEGASGGV